MRVFLIHGMGRSSVSLMPLGKRLTQAGHEVSHFGYLVTRQSLDEIAMHFSEHIARNLDASEPYAIVSHSLGGIITRHAYVHLPHGFMRFVMLAPPNHSPALAQRLRDVTLYRWLTKDAGAKLSDLAFYETLPVPNVATLVIAGTRGPRGSWHPHRGARGDSIVRVDETALRGAQHVEVDAVHTFIMNDAKTVQLVRDFLSP